MFVLCCRAMRLVMLLSSVYAAFSQDSVPRWTAHAAPALSVSDSVAEDNGRLMRLKGGAAWSESPAVSLCQFFFLRFCCVVAARARD